MSERGELRRAPSSFGDLSETMEPSGWVVMAQDSCSYIVRDCSESVGLHTCDNRSDKGVLSSTYPDFDFEVPFTYYDNLYDSIYQENAQGQQPLRLQRFMNEVSPTERSRRALDNAPLSMLLQYSWAGL